jgi:hypothetical protein
MAGCGQSTHIIEVNEEFNPDTGEVRERRSYAGEVGVPLSDIREALQLNDGYAGAALSVSGSTVHEVHSKIEDIVDRKLVLITNRPPPRPQSL